MRENDVVICYLVVVVVVADLSDCIVALHVPYVPVGRIHTVVSCRSGHHQPLQAAAGMFRFLDEVDLF